MHKNIGALWLTALALVILLPFSGCTITKTKDDCIHECKERGAEYAGIAPGAARSGAAAIDICECK